MLGRTGVYILTWICCMDFIQRSDATETKSKLYNVPASGSSESGWYNKAGVAADSKVCGEIGKSILQRGGSVVDAGIAAQLCNGVVDQPHMGLGGGAVNFIYARPRTGGPKEVVIISGDARAPNWITNMSSLGIDYIPSPYSLVRNKDGSPIPWDKYKALSVGVPGEVVSYFEAWKGYGRLPWEELVKPAIKLAREGFVVSAAVENTLFAFSHMVRGTPSLGIFLKDTKVLYSKGEIMKDPVLADTLEVLSKDPMSFYTGELADKVVSDVKEFGGRITKEDLQNYQPRYVEALQVPILGGEYTMTVPGQPFAGPIFALAYNILEGYNMTTSDVASPEGMALFYHRFMETWKFSLSHFNCIGESWEEKPTCAKFVPKLTSKSYADKIRALISDEHIQYNADDYLMMDRDPQVHSKGTSHLSVVGGDGEVFMSTSSINSEFGVEHKGSKTGIIFNNRLIDFSRLTSLDGTGPSDDANSLGPNKEAMSFRTPVMITDKAGRPVLAIGSSGGSRIISALLQDIWMHMHFGLNLKNAIDFPRLVMFPSFPHFSTYYDNFDDRIINILKKEKQHPSLQPVYPMFLYTAVSQGVSLRECYRCDGKPCDENRPCIEAVSDYRKVGAPDGY